MSFGTILPLISLFGVLIGGAAVVGQSFRVSHNTAAFRNLRDIAQGWEDKAKLQAVQIADLEAANAQKDRAIASLNGQVAVLRDTVTGKTELADLATQVTGLVTALESRAAEVLALAGEIRGEVRDMHVTLDSVNVQVHNAAAG